MKQIGDSGLILDWLKLPMFIDVLPGLIDYSCFPNQVEWNLLCETQRQIDWVIETLVLLSNLSLFNV